MGNKFFTNQIAGLATVVAACLLIFQYVSFALSYDDFHEHQEILCKVVLYKYQGENERLSFATNFIGFPKAIRECIPEIEAVIWV